MKYGGEVSKAADIRSTSEKVVEIPRTDGEGVWCLRIGKVPPMALATSGVLPAGVSRSEVEGEQKAEREAKSKGVQYKMPEKITEALRAAGLKTLHLWIIHGLIAPPAVSDNIPFDDVPEGHVQPRDFGRYATDLAREIMTFSGYEAGELDKFREEPGRPGSGHDSEKVRDKAVGDSKG